MSTVYEEETAVSEKIELKEPSQYNVVVHNNDFTSYDEVIFIVSKSFEVTDEEAYDIALLVDRTGKGVCGTYSKEIAETKLDLTELIKDSLVSIMPERAQQIKLLKFTMEQV